MSTLVMAEYKDDSAILKPELLVLDHHSLVTLSVIGDKKDVDILIKSLFNEYGSIYKKDFETQITDYLYKLRNDSGYDYSYRITKLDNNKYHCVVKTDNESYFYDWGGEGLIPVFSRYLNNTKYLPVNNEIVERVIDNTSTEEINKMISICSVFSSHKESDNLNVYRLISLERFNDNLEKIKANEFDDSFDWDSILDISDYLVSFINPIKDKIQENIEVLYDKNKIHKNINDNIKLFDGQIPIVQGAINSLKLKDNRFVYIAARQGVGKTIIANKINHLYLKDIGKDSYVTLVVAPATTLTQWRDEINKVVDNTDVKIIRNTNEFIRFYNDTKMQVDKPTYILVGKETLKLSYKEEHGVRFVKRKIDGFIEEVAQCQDCGVLLREVVNNKVKGFLTESDFKRKKKSNIKCHECGSKLWQATYVKNKKTSVIDFIRKRNIRFDTLIEDEIHESNNFYSVIGLASRVLKRYANKSILLSGTITNGYASSIYNILFSMIPNMLKKDGVFTQSKFIEKYGTTQAVTENEFGDVSLTKIDKIRASSFREVEGINPIVFTKYLSNNFIFADLEEVRSDLPELKEHYVKIKHNPKVLASELNLSKEIAKLSTYNFGYYKVPVIQHYTNKPFSWNEVELKKDEEVYALVQPDNYVEDELLPKEKELIKICKKEKENDRKTWVYCDYVTTGSYSHGESMQERLGRILEEHGFKVFILSSNTKTIERREIIEKNKDDYDVFISNARLISVGVNLQWCPNYVFYTPSYNVNTVKQAMRRGMRINTDVDNHIYHLYYGGSVEEEIMDRFKLKLVESESIQAKFAEVDVERTASDLGNILNKKLDD